MRTNEIRSTYLDFFESRGHTVIPSASLIPIDPALLLNVAGMVPFKSYLLGEETPSTPRATSSQKCIRTEDIDILGTTARHLSFFEMLGNFSFGDYFKEKAIPLAYELITERFELDPDRLWYTVHETDDEAAEIWLDVVGVPPERLQRRDRDNFWQMGVAGPAGPSSEIFYDKGPQYGPDGGPVVDEERFMEFWNLVFMQYIQDEPYHVVGDLPAKSIDTGMGLERMALLMQGVESTFDTDTIRAIMSVAERQTGVDYGSGEKSDISLRILADHARAITFLISDGVVPSNQGRGYILRRLLRRAVRHAQMLGATEPIMAGLIDVTGREMGDAYPAIVERQDFITDMAGREEFAFLRTLASGEQMLEVALETLEAGAPVPGDTAFKLHDTFGFPIELTEEIAAERGLAVDRASFDSEMAQQKDRARAAFKGGNSGDAAEAYRQLLQGVEQTDFVGYEDMDARGSVLAILREGELVERAEVGSAIELVLDVTPFYAESGGQVGDTGTITTDTGTVEILDTQLALPGIHGHRGKVTKGHIQHGQDARLMIDRLRRETTRKNHTGTHILHWALRDVLGDHVHQAGSLVAPDRLRFDFSHHAALDTETLHHIEKVTNDRIIENAAVTTVETSKDEAQEMGAIAFFGDKYGDRVRVVRTGDFSTEFCGGTHVPSTGQIGPLVLVSEGSVGSNMRRVDALTGSAGYQYLVDLRTQLADVSGVLKAQPGQAVEAAISMSDRLRATEARLGEFEDRERGDAALDIVEAAETVNGHVLAAGRIDGLGSDGLRALAFAVRDRIDSGVGVFGSVTDSKAALVVFVTDELVDAGVSAGEIAAIAARAVGGGGSRDAKLAQAGGPKSEGMDEAVETGRSEAHALLTSQ
ncbi:MAG: alanine--tRNA ligase [Acidimicrobiia bacterium]|nr:MAG: alanine--tRNA ligase [Acidimicrobiia bacterium]